MKATDISKICADKTEKYSAVLGLTRNPPDFARDKKSNNFEKLFNPYKIRHCCPYKTYIAYDGWPIWFLEKNLIICRTIWKHESHLSLRRYYTAANIQTITQRRHKPIGSCRLWVCLLRCNTALRHFSKRKKTVTEKVCICARSWRNSIILVI